MKGTKLLFSVWLATGAFCLLQVFFGPGGFIEMARLREQQTRLEARLEALKADNQRLSAQYEALRTSPEAVRLEARSLGWFQGGEVPIRILEGAEFRLPEDQPDLSTVPRLTPGDSDPSLFFRVAWLLLFASFYAFFYLIERLWPTRPRWAALVPLRRENLPARLQTGLDFFRK